MPPTLPFAHVVRNESDDGDSTIIADLILITLALTTSIVLSITPRSKSLSHSRRPFFSLCIVVIAVIFTAFALILSLVSLVLGWTREISLDALSGVVFALATALIQIPVDTLMYGLNVYYMRKRKSLRVRLDKFRYVRFGKRCKFVGKKPWKSNYGGVCGMENCRVKLFIRCLPVKHYHPIFKLFVGEPSNNFFPGTEDLAMPRSPQDEGNIENCRHIAHVPNSLLSTGAAGSMEDTVQVADNVVQTMGRELDVQWHGLRVDHMRNYVKLRDRSDGITAWWWDRVSSATELVDNPSAYRVKDKASMLNALSLLSDIISIGELVFEYRYSYLKYQWTCNNGVIRSKTAAPGIMCCKIIQHLGLDNWAGDNHDMKSVSFPEERGDMEERRLHGILFAILAEKSGMFSAKKDENQREGDDDVREMLLNDTNRRVSQDRRWWHCFRAKSTRERKSGQQILNDIMVCGNDGPVEFDKMCREKVDEWLMEWGCSERTLESEENMERKVEEERRVAELANLQ